MTSADGPTSPYYLAVHGSLAFVESRSVYYVIDIADTTDPVVLGQISSPPFDQRLAFDGTVAVVCRLTEGAQAVDVSDPTKPVLAGEISPRGRTQDVVLSDGLAYLVDDSGGLRVVDVSSPTEPVIIGQSEPIPFMSHIALDGDTVYLASYSGPNYILDVSDPTSPVTLSQFEADETVAIAVQRGYAYLAHEDGRVSIVDASDPVNPVHLSSVDLAFSPRYDISVDGDRVCVDGGRAVIDVSDPANPLLLGACGWVATQQVQRGSLAFAATDLGFLIGDISNPIGSVLVGQSEPNTGTDGVAVVGDYAYVVDEWDGLSVIDVSDPSSPTVLRTVPTGDHPHGVAVRGDYAFVVGHASHLPTFFVLDISDPANPVVVLESDEIKGELIEIRGDRAYVYGDRFRVVDITDPLSPVVVANIDTPNQGTRRYALCVHDGYAYLTTSANQLWVFDVDDVEAGPVAVVPDTVTAMDIDPERDLLSVGRSTGVVVIDISTPTSPVLISEFSRPIFIARAIRVLGRYVLVNDSHEETFLVNLADPTTPVVRAMIDPLWVGGGYYRLVGSEVVGDLLYTTGDYWSLNVFDISDCPPCPADFNADGTVNTQDFIAFLAAWADQRGDDCPAGDCSADLNGDGVVNTQDFVEFLNLWAAGC